MLAYFVIQHCYGTYQVNNTKCLKRRKNHRLMNQSFLSETLTVPTLYLLKENTPSNAASFFSFWYFPMPSPSLGSFPEHICTVMVSTLLSVVLIMIPIIADPTAVLIENLCNSSSRTIGKRDLKLGLEINIRKFVGMSSQRLFLYLKVR